jgi:hypothetical protein
MSEAAAERVKERRLADDERAAQRNKPGRTVMEKLEGEAEKCLSAEWKHRESCGTQASSRKATSPGWTFGFHSSQVYKTDVARIKIDTTDRRHRETHLKPGPGTFDPAASPASPTTVLAGWELAKRFENNGFATRTLDGYKHTERLEKAHELWADAVVADRPHRFSKKPTHGASTARRNADLQNDAADAATPTAFESEMPYLSEQAPLEKRTNKARKNQGIGFGTSGLGFRFKPGTKFSKEAQFRTQSRHAGYEGLRNGVTDAELLAMARSDSPSKDVSREGSPGVGST